MHTVCDSLGTAMMRRRADPERERRTGDFSWNDTHTCSVWGSQTAVAWLAAICQEAGLPVRAAAWTGQETAPLLVLAQSGTGTELSALCRAAGADRAVVSLDCPEGRELAARRSVETFTYSECRDAADLTAKNLRLTGRGLTFVAVTREALARVAVPVDELYPALAVLSAACRLGVPLERAAAVVSGPLTQQAKTG